MRHTLIVGVTAIALTTAGSGLRAQDKEPTTATGCMRAVADGKYALVLDDGAKYQVEPGDDVKLVDHENHRVELTGELDKSATEPVLKAKALKMVAASCEPAAQ
jgi:hypothetical protein